MTRDAVGASCSICFVGRERSCKSSWSSHVLKGSCKDDGSVGYSFAISKRLMNSIKCMVDRAVCRMRALYTDHFFCWPCIFNVLYKSHLNKQPHCCSSLGKITLNYGLLLTMTINLVCWVEKITYNNQERVESIGGVS